MNSGEVNAIFIDANLARVVPVKLKKNGDSCLRSMYQLLECDCICSGWRWDNEDWLVVDDNGLLIGPTKFFSIAEDGYSYKYAGNGLICGANSEGETVNVKQDWMDRAKKVQFFTRDTPLDPSEIPPPEVIGFANADDFFEFLKNQGGRP